MAKKKFRIWTNVLYLFLIILFSGLLGAYSGIKNAQDYKITSMKFDELSDEVKVYRDDYYIPTIIAKNEADLFFAQGYEYARDRLWQAELMRSFATGEVSRLFGQNLTDADIYLKSLQMKEAGINEWTRLQNDDPTAATAVRRYVLGLNKYIELHRNNLPVEFDLLGSRPKKWTPADVVAIHGVLSEDLSFSALNREFQRRDLAIQFGPEKAVELYPIFNPTAEAYYLAQNYTQFKPVSLFSNLNGKHIANLNFNTFSEDVGSNNWVIGPELTKSGKPLIANDPHLGLTTPGIWWQVHLVVEGEGGYHVEGYALPAPGIVLGHNEHAAWGFTNTSTDALDVYYFLVSENGTQYYINGQWKDFVVKKEEIELGDGSSFSFDLRLTDYGPVLDKRAFNFPNDKYVYVMRWVLNENFSRDDVFKAILDLNRAENAQEIHDALEYFAVPGQNIVYATVDGEWGYQYTGLIANRTIPGSGVIPQNGSDPNYGWNGAIPYSQHLWIQGNKGEVPGGKQYFVTANQKVDKRDIIYVSDRHDVGYRAERISQLIEAKGSNLDIGDMQDIQGDTTDLYAEDMLGQVLSTIKGMSFPSDINKKADRARSILVDWTSGKGAFKMDRKQVAPTIFLAFRVFFEELTLKDEFDQMGPDAYEKFSGNTEFAMMNILNKSSSPWYDRIDTPEVETQADIVKLAFDKAIRYLMNEYGNRINAWEYGNIHKVVFEHPIGGTLKFFNEGNTAADGDEFTVKAGSTTPEYVDGKINFILTFASSMRFTARLESTWSHVRGITVPGEVGSLWNKHRGESVGDWVDNELHDWNFSKKQNKRPNFTYLPN